MHLSLCLDICNCSIWLAEVVVLTTLCVILVISTCNFFLILFLCIIYSLRLQILNNYTWSVACEISIATYIITTLLVQPLLYVNNVLTVLLKYFSMTFAKSSFSDYLFTKC